MLNTIGYSYLKPLKVSRNKCRNCGSVDIETAHGDAVCTECGFMLEDQLIVSETTFVESPSGNMMVLGQFVANDSIGGATGFGAACHVSGKESRWVTLENARKGITHLCMQLQLNQHCIDISVNFCKMALSRQLISGRKQVHNHAACVYITRRTEGINRRQSQSLCTKVLPGLDYTRSSNNRNNRNLTRINRINRN